MWTHSRFDFCTFKTGDLARAWQRSQSAGEIFSKKSVHSRAVELRENEWRACLQVVKRDGSQTRIVTLDCMALGGDRSLSERSLWDGSLCDRSFQLWLVAASHTSLPHNNCGRLRHSDWLQRPTCPTHLSPWAWTI